MRTWPTIASQESFETKQNSLKIVLQGSFLSSNSFFQFWWKASSRLLPQVFPRQSTAWSSSLPKTVCFSLTQSTAAARAFVFSIFSDTLQELSESAKKTFVNQADDSQKRCEAAGQPWGSNAVHRGAGNCQLVLTAKPGRARSRGGAEKRRDDRLRGRTPRLSMLDKKSSTKACAHSTQCVKRTQWSQNRCLININKLQEGQNIKSNSQKFLFSFKIFYLQLPY